MKFGKNIGIFGAGPAGLSAALWLKNLGFEPWIAEPCERTGGMQNFNFLVNQWVLGLADLSGPEIAARFVSHATTTGVRIACGVRPWSVEGNAGNFRIGLANHDDSILYEDCAALLIATGTRYREAEVLRDISGFSSVPPQRIAYGPYAFANISACAGRRVLIVGGGDNAFENVRLLLGTASAIHMVLRSPPRAQGILCNAVWKAQDDGMCRVHQPANIVSLAMRDHGIEVQLDNFSGALEVDCIHVLAGYEPNTQFLRQIFGTASAAFTFDSENYLVVDAAGRTGMAGVYAAGDVCNPAFPNVVSAVALGARTAKAIEMDLHTR